MSAPCEDLARILNGYGDLVLGTNLFGFELGFNGDAEIDKQLAILDTGTASVDSYPIYEHPTIQLFFVVSVRKEARMFLTGPTPF